MISDLIEVTLKKACWEKASNGQPVVKTYHHVKKYFAFKQNLEDDISVSIYGANINKMLRIETIRHELEQYLNNIIENKKEKVSDYFIFYNSSIYKITSVNEYKIVIERV